MRQDHHFAVMSDSHSACGDAGYVDTVGDIPS